MAIERPDHEERAFIAQLIRTLKVKTLRTCLVGDAHCEGTIVRAHSIQNARVLDVLCDNNHVQVLSPDMAASGHAVLQLIGRNTASTFTGFCGYHDAALFREVESGGSLDCKDKAHVVLLTLRAIAREYWAKSNAIRACRATSEALASRDAVRLAEVLSVSVAEAERLLESGVVASQGVRMIGWYIEGCQQAEMRLRHRFKSLLHQYRYGHQHLTQSLCLEIPSWPSFAVCAAISPGRGFDRQWIGSLAPRSPVAELCVNVYPLGNTEHVLFSYHRSDAEAMTRLLEPVVMAALPARRIMISRLIVMHCENIAFNPKRIAAMPHEEQRDLERLFGDTAMEEATLDEFPVGDLFW